MFQYRQIKYQTIQKHEDIFCCVLLKVALNESYNKPIMNISPAITTIFSHMT